MWPLQLPGPQFTHLAGGIGVLGQGFYVGVSGTCQAGRGAWRGASPECRALSVEVWQRQLLLPIPAPGMLPACQMLQEVLWMFPSLYPATSQSLCLSPSLALLPLLTSLCDLLCLPPPLPETLTPSPPFVWLLSQYLTSCTVCSGGQLPAGCCRGWVGSLVLQGPSYDTWTHRGSSVSTQRRHSGGGASE